MKKYREVLDTPDRVLPNSQIAYGALFDAFHCPFPALAGDYLKSHSGYKYSRIVQEPSSSQESDPFTKLSLEIFEPIFTKLTASAIEIARFTCRAWYQRIVTSSHALEAVVDLDKHGDAKG